MKEVLTSVLDFLGVLAVAIGLGLLLSIWLGPGPGCILAGLVLIVGSTLATAMARPPRGEK